MPVMLEVAIGLVFVYLVLSLLCSAIAEAIEHYFRYRADYLRQGIEKLLLAGDAALSAQVYRHPLITSLYTPSRLEGKGRAGGPSYIPSRQFVLALLDIARGAAAPGGAAGAGTPSQLKAAVDANGALPASLKHALGTLIDDAGDDIDKVKTNVQTWFDNTMDRVAGWYKRRAQLVLFVVGAVVAVVVNVDTMSIINTLSNDSAVRSAVVAAAEAQVRQPSQATLEASTQSVEQVTASIRQSVMAVSNQLGALGLPIGWRQLDPGGVDRAAAAAGRVDDRYRVDNRILPGVGDVAPQVSAHFFGWLLTAIAVSFGAPFWFDVLNKVMVIRSTVKPREKSGEEGSEDRIAGATPQAVRIEIAAAKPS